MYALNIKLVLKKSEPPKGKSFHHSSNTCLECPFKHAPGGKHESSTLLQSQAKAKWNKRITRQLGFENYLTDKHTVKECKNYVHVFFLTH